MTPTRGVAEVRHPARKERVQLGDHPAQLHSPVSPGDPADALLGPLKTHRGHAQAAARQQPVAQELAFPDERHRTLLPVHAELEFAFQEPRDPGQCVMGTPPPGLGISTPRAGCGG